MSRRLIREEGLLCGGSCGSTMVAALKVCEGDGSWVNESSLFLLTRRVIT